MHKSNTRTKLLAVLGAALTALLLFAVAAQAKTPAPGFEQFAGCASPEESPTTPICIRSDVTGGHLNIGTKEVPIEHPLTIGGAVDEEFNHFTPSPVGGLSVVNQKIPGGVIGLTGLTWLLEFFGSEALTLYGAAELAGEPTNFTINTVTLPIKVHLINPGGLLGNKCYVGSNSNPITLNLTTGTTNPPPPNEPITGKFPEIKEEGFILYLSNGTYVDNSFSAPGANGCTLYLFGFIPISINGLVNEQSGLPAAAGTNEAVENFNIEIAPQAIVYP